MEGMQAMSESGCHPVSSVAAPWVDLAGEQWAREIPIECYPAQWVGGEQDIGGMRVLKRADALVAVGVSVGTAHMISLADGEGSVFVFRV